MAQSSETARLSKRGPVPTQSRRALPGGVGSLRGGSPVERAASTERPRYQARSSIADKAIADNKAIIAAADMPRDIVPLSPPKAKAKFLTRAPDSPELLPDSPSETDRRRARLQLAEGRVHQLAGGLAQAGSLFSKGRCGGRKSLMLRPASVKPSSTSPKEKSPSLLLLFSMSLSS